MKKMQMKLRSLALALFCLTLIVANSCKKDGAQQLTVTDIDGNVYHTVKIGTQTWMVENLKTARFNDGTGIPLVTEVASWKAQTEPARCWYNNDSATNHKDYGMLYNWYAVNTGKLCPKGWHVPTQADWEVLIDYLIEADPGKIKTSDNVSVEDFVGLYLKEPGLTHWQQSDAYASENFTGFKALPGGYRDNLSSFNDKTQKGFWWTSTAIDANFARYYNLYYNLTSVYTEQGSKKRGYSVLCVKD